MDDCKAPFGYDQSLVADESLDIPIMSNSKVELPSSNRSLWFHFKTLLLFSKSDFKTVIVPQTLFAASAVLSNVRLTATHDDDEYGSLLGALKRLPLMLVWTWLNLLVEDIANQRLAGSIAEDRVNKPWRPLPSKRLSPDEAQRWLLVVIVLGIGFSHVVGGIKATFTLNTFIWMYNDLDGSNSSVLLRNALNAGGLMCFSWGATEVLAGCELLPAGFAWIIFTGAIILTTVHTQDLPDQEGDAARGRKTAPLMYGQGWARLSLAAAVLIWSVAAPMFWGSSLLSGPSATLLTTGGSLAGLAQLQGGQTTDEVVWKLWCLWMTLIYASPLLFAPYRI